MAGEKPDKYNTEYNPIKPENKQSDEEKYIMGIHGYKTQEKIKQETNEGIDKMFEITELTNEEKKIIDEIQEKNLMIEDNIENEGIRGKMIILDLENNEENFKMFIPDDIHLKATIINSNAEKLYEYITNKGIIYTKIPAAIQYLLKKTHLHGWFNENNQLDLKILNVKKEPGKFDEDTFGDKANLIFKKID